MESMLKFETHALKVYIVTSLFCVEEENKIKIRTIEEAYYSIIKKQQKNSVQMLILSKVFAI